MMNGRVTPRILVVEDEPGVRNLIALALKHQGYAADFAEDIADAAGKLQEIGTRYTALVVDAGMENTSELMDIARRKHQPVPIIALVDELASDGDNLSVDEILYKPLNGERLRKAVQNCMRVHQQDHSNAADTSVSIPEIGASCSVWRAEMQALVEQVAAADVPVLVQGETGAGKEVLARQLHALSPRAKKPFLKVNCAALPSELIESELFGYERGAFTGAFKNTPGKFEVAEGGTLLLDEIGDMDIKLQAKLLQVLQDGEFIRLGSSEPRKVDVRVIAATHCDLERAIAEGRFREDLYYRLNIITLHVLPLRERKDEILPLVYHFMRKHSAPATPPVQITPALHHVLLTHDWPGNVRELENVIRKLLVLRRPEVVAEDLQTRARRRNRLNETPDDSARFVSFPKPVTDFRQESSVPVPIDGAHAQQAVMRPNGHPHDQVSTIADLAVRNGGRPRPVEDVDNGWSELQRVDKARREAESEVILSALSSTLWNRKRAAELLNIDYKALLYKMKKLGIVERAIAI